MARSRVRPGSRVLLELGGLLGLPDFPLVRAERPGGGAIEQLDVEPPFQVGHRTAGELLVLAVREEISAAGVLHEEDHGGVIEDGLELALPLPERRLGRA